MFQELDKDYRDANEQGVSSIIKTLFLYSFFFYSPPGGVDSVMWPSALYQTQTALRNGTTNLADIITL